MSTKNEAERRVSPVDQIVSRIHGSKRIEETAAVGDVNDHTSRMEGEFVMCEHN